MKTLHINIRDTLLNNEKKLLDVKIRSSSDELSKLLTSDFSEICSSGAMYRYKPGDIFSKKNDPQMRFSISKFELHVLSNECVQVVYRLKQELEDGTSRTTVRNSIWVRIGNLWKLKFHQGTLAILASGSDSWEVVK